MENNSNIEYYDSEGEFECVMKNDNYDDIRTFLIQFTFSSYCNEEISRKDYVGKNIEYVEEMKKTNYEKIMSMTHKDLDFYYKLAELLQEEKIKSMDFHEMIPTITDGFFWDKTGKLVFFYNREEDV